MPDVFIYDVLRTPRGRGKAGKGGLSQHHPQELLAQTLNHKAAREIEGKRFDSSLFAVKNDDGSVALAGVEHPRADTTLESLATLAPAFQQLGGTAMGPGGETVDELALKRYPDTRRIEHVHT